jgi:metal-responsive CopG/Arc/MetJ family transcriptional regulator
MAAVKTAISLEQALFEQVEARACELKMPRSAVVAEALKKYFFDLETEDMVRRINEVEASLTEEDRAEDREWLKHTAESLARIQEREGDVWDADS